jgi:hypothetical protein
VPVNFDSSDVNSSGFTNGCPRPPMQNGLFSCGTSLGPGESARVQFDASGRDDGTLTITARTLVCPSIDPNCNNNTDRVSIPVVTLSTKDERVPIAFASLLESSSERPLRGELALNGESLGGVTARSPRSLSTNGFGSRNVVEAWTTTASPEEGRWEFDFRSTPRFARGSLVVESGQVLVLEGDRVVFRLSGAPGERLRFRFSLER